MKHILAIAAAVLLSASGASAAGKKPQKKAGGDVLAVVNGTPISKSAAMDRAWKEYGTAVLNEMAEEILIKQASEADKVAPDMAEVEARLKRFQSQFPDEAAFKQRLAANGTSLEAMRARTEEQVLLESLVTKAKALSVTDEEAKVFFDANKEKLATPEAVRLRTVVVASEKEANDFLAAIKAGADFSKLAAQVSLDPNTKDKGGDLGFITRGMLQPDIEKVAFALKPGEVSATVKNSLGTVILKADEIRAPKPAVFNEVKDDLKKALLADKVSKALPGYLQELRAKAKFEAGAAAAKL